MRQFEIGKSYALHLPAKDGHGKTTFLTDIYTVTRRTPCYLTFSHISSDGTKMPHCRCKIFTSDMRGEFVHATAFFCLYADSYIDDDSQPEIPATADDAISASNNDSALASQHANVATAESETTAQQELPAIAESKTYDKTAPVMEDLAARSLFANDFRTICTILRCRCRNPEDVAKFAQYMNISISADADIREGTRIIAKTIVDRLAPLPPENLYMDESYSDAPGDNSYPEQDIPECRENDAIHADNPGFTVIPSREIKRPDYASYPEAIHDECPCVNVPACDIQTYNHAAVVHERNTSTAEGFGIVLLKHRQLGFTFNTDCNPRQIWFDFEF